MNTQGLVEWHVIGEEARTSCASFDWRDAAEVTERAHGVPAGPAPAPAADPPRFRRLHIKSYAKVEQASGWDVVSYELEDADDLGRVLQGWDQGRAIDIVTLNQDTFKGRLVPSRVDQTVKALLAKGVVFELLVAPALESRSGRQAFIDHLKQLVKVTRCRNVLLSSGGPARALRRPADLANLLTLGGISYSEASHLLRHAHDAVLARVEERRGRRGVVQRRSRDALRAARLPPAAAPGASGTAACAAQPVRAAALPSSASSEEDSTTDAEETEEDDLEDEDEDEEGMPPEADPPQPRTTRATFDESSASSEAEAAPARSVPAQKRATLDDSSADDGGDHAPAKRPRIEQPAAAEPPAKRRVVTKRTVVKKKVT